MNALQVIEDRRSIRKFEAREVPKEAMEQILRAGVLAPSAKNRQPWRFVAVTTPEGREGLFRAMQGGLQWMEDNMPGETEWEKALLAGAWNTLRIMREAPTHILIFNTEGTDPQEPLSTIGERFGELANVQSVGACIQNMTLAATALGLGSLWIADVYSAYYALTEWAGLPGQLVAALTVGYPAESPAPRPRMSVEDVTTWR